MRYIRYQDSSGASRIAIEQPDVDGSMRIQFMEANEDDLATGLTEGFTPSYRSVATDREILRLAGDVTLMTPLDAPELWSASVTYPVSWQARLKEAHDPDPYHRLVEEGRSMFHLKDAGGHRTVASGEPVAIRSDATWVVPEPEIGVVLGERGTIIGYTIVNDICCRDIRGANPLYLSQATTYRNSCSMGPSVYVEPGRRKPFTIYLRISQADGTEVVSERASTKEMQSTFRQLVDLLARDNPLPPGTVVATGAAIVPPESFSLQPGHVVEIHVPEIGTLANPVVLVADLEENALAERRRAAALARLPE